MKKLYYLSLSILLILATLPALAQKTGINKTNPEKALDVHGDIRGDSSLTIGPEGDSNGDSSLYFNNGKLGIGTNNPSGQFEVISSTLMAGSTADQTGSGTASASSNSSFAFQTFDNSVDNHWHAGFGVTTGWLQYDFGSGQEKIITLYTIETDPCGGGFSTQPKDWTFEGSHDANSWTVLDTRVNANLTLENTFYFQGFDNTTAYRYYRINITANNGSSQYVEIAEMQLIAGDYSISQEGLKVNDETVTISGAYTLPTTDGLANQVVATDGSGSSSWTTLPANTDDQTLSLSGQILSITGASNSSVTLPANTDNQNLVYQR